MELWKKRDKMPDGETSAERKISEVPPIAMYDPTIDTLMQMGASATVESEPEVEQ